MGKRMIHRAYSLLLVLCALVNASVHRKECVVETRKINQNDQEGMALRIEVERLADNLGLTAKKCVKKEEQQKLEPGWYTPRNNYQYIPTNTPGTWNESRQSCRKMGANLAVIGIRNLTSLQLLAERFKVTSVLANWLWVGLNDEDKDGSFTWIDRVLSNHTDLYWTEDEPNSPGIENCGHLWRRWRKHRINDLFCDRKIRGLCEKKLN